jgi:hypothetical protein
MLNQGIYRSSKNSQKATPQKGWLNGLFVIFYNHLFISLLFFLSFTNPINHDKREHQHHHRTARSAASASAIASILTSRVLTLNEASVSHRRLL